MSSEEVAYREEHPAAHGAESPAVEDLTAREQGGGDVLKWLIGLAIVLPVLGLYAALAYAAYLVAQALV